MGSLEFVRRVFVLALLTSFGLVGLGGSGAAFGQTPGSGRRAAGASVGGSITDPLGAPVSGATVTLLEDGQSRGEATTDAHGQFEFTAVPEGRYQVRVGASGFEPQTIDPFFVGGSGRVPVAVSLHAGLEEHVVVTAAATEVPTSQVAASVTVVDHAMLDALRNPDVLNAFRLVPGVNVVQTGAPGGTTSLFIRGGNSDFTKLLVDGVPANDIGGGIDFGALAATGVDHVEVLRDPNSAIYGSDAMSGVVNVTTRRGETRIPEAALTLDGGDLATSSGDLSFGGAVRRVDYFSDVSHFQTDNQVPNDAYRNTSYAGRFGGVLGSSILLTGTLRTIDSRAGSPNAIEIYGIPDDSTETSRYTFGSVAATIEHSDRWQSTIRFGVMSREQDFLTPAPIGQPFDPFGFGPNYLGNTVTITGANGDSVTGQAILDFGGVYPAPFTSKAGHDSVSGQTTYRLSDRMELSGGVRVDHESGADGAVPSPPESTRTDAGGFAEVRATTGRLFATASLGVDHDKSFGTAATPRASVAFYARKPASSAALGSTKLTVNAGTGIKAPSVSQEQSSLFAVAATVPSLMNAGIAPIGPERTRGFDGGVEQAFWGERVRARVTAFDSQFSDIIEFVSNTVLPELGISQTIAAALPGGVYVNSSSYYARGAETSMDAQLSPDLRVSASYTFLSAVITKSFTGGVLAPAINPAFPNTPIGAFAPLVGAPPFRRPANSGTLAAFYTHGRVSMGVAAQFAGKSDDSTFATDGFFGNSMLLPNHDLDAGYARIDVTGAYLVQPRVKLYLAIDNALGQSYAPVFGFPALSRTFRAGATVTLGGDRR
jgi:vitamin B12 transporter